MVSHVKSFRLITLSFYGYFMQRIVWTEKY